MPTPVIMPKFGMAQEEGTIIRWLKNEGDTVEKGEELLEVQTDKIDMEVESPASGILSGIRFGVDATVPVATIIAHIFAANEPIVAIPTAQPATVHPTVTTAKPTAIAQKVTPVAQRLASEKGVDLAQVAGSGPAGRILRADVEGALQGSVAATSPVGNLPQKSQEKPRATPAARRLARQSAIDLASLLGSGPNGRIQSADVLASLVENTNKPVAPEPGLNDVTFRPPPSALRTSSALKGMRKTIATRLTQSWQQTPLVTFTTSVDMSEMDALRKKLGAEVEAATGFKLSVTVLLAKAVAAALLRHPRLNATLTALDGELLLTEHETVNLGIAVALEDGLIVPVVNHAQQRGLADLAAAIGDLSQRARARQLHPDETAAGTFSISNLGMFAVEHFTALINPPQVAILAVGQSQIKPVWDGQAFQPRPLVELTLSADHRAVDGAIAAAFLTDLKRLIEEPTRLLL